MRDSFIRSQLEQVAQRWSLSFDQQEADALLDAVEGIRVAYARVAALAASSLPGTHPPPSNRRFPATIPTTLGCGACLRQRAALTVC